MVEEAVARREVARASARLDVGRAFPGPAQAFVVAFGRLHREADGGDRGIGAQAQVRPEDVAFGGQVRQGRGHPPGGADELRARVEIVVVGIARVVEEHDEVDVGGVVELPCPHLPHGERDHPAGGGEVVLRHAGQLAARDEWREFGLERRGDGRVGETGQRRRHLLERPDAAEIGERDEERGAPLGLAQARGHVLRGELRRIREEPVERGFRRQRQRLLDPWRFAFEKAAEIG